MCPFLREFGQIYHRERKEKMKKKVVLAMLMAAILGAGTVHAELSTEEIQKLDAYYTLASNYITKGEYEKAEEYVEHCFEYCNEETVSAELLADLYLKKGCIDVIHGENEEALEALDQAIGYQSDLSDAYLVKVQIYLDEKKYEDAIKGIQSYMELTGDNEMNGTLAQIYEVMGEAEKAAETYGAYIQNSGATEEAAAFENALYQMEIGLYDMAISNFEACMEAEDYAQAATYNRLICLMNKGEYETAEKGFEEGIQAEWGYDGILYNYAVCQMMRGDYDTAIETFKESREKENYQTEATRNIALCLMDQEKAEEAIAELDALIEEENALEAEARFYRASCYISKEEYEQALDDLNVCIEKEYNVSQSYYQRAQVYKALEEEELYLKDLEASVKPTE